MGIPGIRAGCSMSLELVCEEPIHVRYILLSWEHVSINVIYV